MKRICSDGEEISTVRYETLYDGTDIPVIGLGTWRIGGAMSANYSQDEAFIDTIRTALELGYRHIDTAEMYGEGHTEELIGNAIRDFPRDELFVTTKVWHTNLRHDDVLAACDSSLRRLQLEYVDLYLVHWPNPRVPLNETFRALNRLVADGRVKRIGVSNFSLSQLKRAQELADTPIAANQVEYHLLSREPAHSGMIDYCRSNDILVTAYSPLGKGRVLDNTTVQRIANQRDATPAQVALAWVVQQRGVVTIPKSTSEQHLRENLAAAELRLSDEEIAELDAVQ